MTGRRWLLPLVGVGLIAIIILYTLVDPNERFMPKCMFKVLTGYDCPGCGSQRAFHAMLHGDIAAAWHYNAALFVGVPLIILLVFRAFMHDRLPRLHRALNSSAFIKCVAAAIVVWWIGRNIL